MLEANPKAGGPPVRLAGSPKTATLPVRLNIPLEGVRIGRLAPPPRRTTKAASKRTPKSSSQRRERSRGNPPLPARLTRRCSVSGTSPSTPKSRTRPSAQPRRAGTGDRAWSEASSTAPESASYEARATPTADSFAPPEGGTPNRRAIRETPCRVPLSNLPRKPRRTHP